MPVPTYVDSVTQGANTNNSPTVAVPTGVASGDIAVVSIYIESDTITVTAVPTGFTQAPDSPIRTTNGGTEQSQFVYWKRLTAADSGSYGFTLSASIFWRTMSVAYRGATGTGDPWNVTNAAARASASSTTPAVSDTTTVADTKLLWMATSYSTGPWTPPSGFTEREDASTEMSMADKDQATAAATGSLTGTGPSNWMTAWLGALMGPQGTTFAGAVSLSVGKTLTVNGTVIGVHQGAVNLSSSPTLTVGGTVSPTHVGAVNLQVGKTLTAQAGQSGQVSMSVGKTLSTNGQITLLQVAVSMSVTKTLTAGTPIQTMFALVQMDVTATITMDGVRSRSSKLFTRFPRPPFEHPFRLIAQEILTGEIVDWDLPVQNDFEFTRQLSGPTVMTGSFKPEIISVQELGLDGYAYWFHVEINEEIRASGIFMPPTYEDQGLSFTCEGHSSIPHFTTWTSSLSAIGIDVFTIVRNIWNHVQSDPRGNFNVQVATQLSGRTLGTPATSETTPPVPPETEPTVRQIDAEPYELQWWEAPNCGDQIDTLAQQTPFDYRERVAWNSTKTDVVRYLDLGYPRLGTTRTNLEFNEENILEIVPVQENEESYASEVIVIGAGEGSATIRGYAAEHFANRIKKSYVLTDKTITTKVRADDVAKAELGIRRGRLFEISEIVVRPYHTNAMIGEYDVGDDIYIVVDIPWMNIPYGAWYRITSITINPANDIVRIAVEPSASFRYPPVATAP